MSARGHSRRNDDGSRKINAVPNANAGSASQSREDGVRKRVRFARDPKDKRDRSANARPTGPLLKKIKLENYVTMAQVLDREMRDCCEVRLTSFAPSVTFKQVKKVCKGAVEVRAGYHGKKIAWVFAKYLSQEEAAAAARTLQGTVMEGSRVKVSYQGHQWKEQATRPRLLYNTLDVQRLPKRYRTAGKVASIFPTGRVLMVNNKGSAQVKFKSPEALLAAVRKPRSQSVNGTPLRFAFAVERRRA
ncbi:hypothetical protein MTO96_034257 [Rhipicephalus appendiculatus]